MADVIADDTVDRAVPETGPANLFVLGLDDFNREKLEAVAYNEPVRFHPVLDMDALTSREDFDVEATLAQAEAEIRAHRHRAHGLVNYWDFPVSLITAMLARRLGLPGPSLEAVLGCEHKYWSRLQQKRVAPDYVPMFEAVDPFDDAAIDAIGVDYPFWIKPVKGFSSHLGFRVGNHADLQRAIAEIRAGIAEIGNAFNAFMDHAEVPTEVARIGGNHCLVESIIGGSQCTLEGFMFDGRMHAYGIVDSFRYPNGSSFSRYQYPSGLPRRVTAKMIEIAEAVLVDIGLDNNAFNMEFFWDRRRDRIWILEINPRISQSHGDLFQKVDGIPNHQVVVDLAMGVQPQWHAGDGEFRRAAKIFLRRFSDGRVTRVPSAAEIDAVIERFPGTLVEIPVHKGMLLSELESQEQDSYSYNYAIIFMGARSGRRLRANFREVEQMLAFEFDENTGGRA